MKYTCVFLLLVVCHVLRPTSAAAEIVEIRPAVVREGDAAHGSIGIEYRSGDELVARSTAAAPAGVAIKLPGGQWQPVRFHAQSEQGRGIVLGPETIGPLTFLWSLEKKTPSLVERVLEVTADAAKPTADAAEESHEPHRFTVAFPLDLAIDGEQASFKGGRSRLLGRNARHREVFATPASSPRMGRLPHFARFQPPQIAARAAQSPAFARSVTWAFRGRRGLVRPL